ncbi:MAG: hypothetical protein ACE5G2_13260 [Candidatus Krumholzibacteriia bacterium]
MRAAARVGKQWRTGKVAHAIRLADPRPMQVAVVSTTISSPAATRPIWDWLGSTVWVWPDPVAVKEATVPERLPGDLEAVAVTPAVAVAHPETTRHPLRVRSSSPHPVVARAIGTRTRVDPRRGTRALP